MLTGKSNCLGPTQFWDVGGFRKSDDKFVSLRIESNNENDAWKKAKRELRAKFGGAVSITMVKLSVTDLQGRG